MSPDDRWARRLTVARGWCCIEHISVSPHVTFRVNEVLMLADFVISNREKIISRCQAKVAKRSSPPPSKNEIDHGVPIFLDELVAELRLGLSPNPDISVTAAKHGHDLLKLGFSSSQLVHGYGDVCQVITEMAIENDAPIGSDDFRMLNRCLDDAIASAITQYGNERDATTSAKADRERNPIRASVDRLRAFVSAAQGAFDAIQSGKVGAAGSTGTVLGLSLGGIADTIEQLQADTRDFGKP
jgi:hypothetical protein